MKLTQEIIENDTELAAAIGEVLHGDRAWSLHSDAVRLHQDALRANCSPVAWQRSLSLEELVNARLEDALSLVARWAFQQRREQR